MSKNEFKILYRTPLVFIKRGKTRIVTFYIKNIGQSTWHDPTWEDKSSHIVGGLVNTDEKQDFNLWWGIREGNKTSRRFERVYTKYGVRLPRQKSKVKPTQILRLKLRIEARKFATKGKHNLKFAMFERSSNEIEKKEIMNGYPKSIRVVVVPRLRQFVYLLKAVKLHLVKPGKLKSVYSNESYKKIKDTNKFEPVVMAAWKRIDQLPRTLSALSEQTGSKPILYLWNNNLSAIKEINELASKNKLPVKVYHSRYNIGGFGRFYLANNLAEQYEKVIFIDDDQFPDKAYIGNISKEFEPKSIKSQWAFKFKDDNNYWHKQLVEKGGEAEYCGTGGMIVDTRIFDDKSLYKCPKKYWFIEDLWLSFFARHNHGWNLSRSYTDLDVTEDGLDQLTNLIDAKTEFYKLLADTKSRNLVLTNQKSK